ncbi:MAG TPA: hypothetical protein P5080_00955 [Candidatus Paceibacterota bacterium]|nr:hypothetical protein [Candidatus Pacearchaeota archaeon]HRZ50541.1 hypothetical protein [Candidatus Paceibacterota bacterium]HSA36262.1 hypothetical protein [Candidatus Paceibacterota bacterium]
MKISKRKLLYAVPLAIVSFEIYIGALLGYIGALFLAGKETGMEGYVRSLIFDLGKYRLHLHHWVLCLTVIPVAIHYNLAFVSDQFVIGMLGGLAYQGISCYNDWHQVLFRIK